MGGGGKEREQKRKKKKRQTVLSTVVSAGHCGLLHAHCPVCQIFNKTVATPRK